MKTEWKRRVNLLQMHYRFKKYGEPIIVGQVEDLDEDEGWKEFNSKEVAVRLKRIEENRLKEMSQVERLFGKKKADEISDLHSINEDSDDEVFTKKEEVQQNLLQGLLKDILYRESKKMTSSILTVHSLI